MKAAERPADPLGTLSEHLARLLQHADKLLKEWEAHADGVRAKIDADTRSTSEVMQKALASALEGLSGLVAKEIDRAVGHSAASVREDLERAAKAAGELVERMGKAGAASAWNAAGDTSMRTGLEELHKEIRALAAGRPVAGGRKARPDRVTVILLLAANALLVAVLAVVLFRPAPGVPVAQVAAIRADAGPADAAAVPAQAPAPAAPAPTTPSQTAPVAPAAAGPPAHHACGGIALEAGANAPRLIQVCVNQLCSPFPPLKVDGAIRPGGVLAKTLAACKPSDPDLLAALVELERQKAIYRLACPLPEKADDGTVAVTVRWLLACPTTK